MSEICSLTGRLLRAQWGQPNLTLQQKIALGIAAPILIPLGVVAGVILLPVAAGRAIRNKIHDVQLLREYRENKLEAMSTMTEEVTFRYISVLNSNISPPVDYNDRSI